MSLPDDTTPPEPSAPELGGLDPQQLLRAGLQTVIAPVGLAPDADATIPMAGPQPTLSGKSSPDLPLPEELTDLLPHGNYSVEGFLGQGGMGAVYKGTQVRLQRHVAIKIMRRDQGKDYDFEERFRREALAMAKLNHPNIVSVIDFGEAGPDYLYIVMELVDGADLMDVIRTGTMTQEMALTLLPQICDALQFAHQHGIVHRDIKPSNIMLTRDGRVKMCDFGLAKRYDADSGFRTQTGTGMGTPDYAAPEQFDPSAQIDHRADIYALGVMIYQMITGQLPRGVWKAPSQRSECAPQWDSIVSRAMQSDPADRYQQASEVKTDVSSISLKTAAPSPNLSLKGEGKAARAAKSDPSPLRGERLGEGSVARTKKSHAPLLFGILGLAAVIALGAFFALRPSAKWPAKSSVRSVPANPTAQGTVRTTSSEPTAIKLWDSPEKLPKSPGIRWENEAMRLDNAGPSSGPESHNAILRASIRAAPDTKGTVLGLRTNDVPATQARLVVNWSDGKAALSTAATGGVGLGEWSLPRAYGADEWVRVELRAIDDDFTVLVDGQVIGSAHSEALSRPGKATLYAGANGYFRDIEYVPLDKQSAASTASSLPVSAPSTPATSYPQPAQWTDATAGLLPQYLPQGALVADGEWLKAAATKAFDLKWALQSRNPIVRVVFTDRVAILLRRTRNDQLKNDDTFYLADVGHEGVIIGRRDRGEGSDALMKLAEKYAPNQLDGAHEAVFAAQGDTLTLWLDGRLVATAHDGALTSGGLAVMLTKGDPNGDGRIKKVEYGELPDLAPPAVSSSPSLPVSKSSTKFPPGQWVKLFTKFEDLPEHLRKPDSGVKLKDGWIRREAGVSKSVWLPPQLTGNYGVRLRILSEVKPSASDVGIVLRKHSKQDGAQDGGYAASFDGAGLLCVRNEGFKWSTINRTIPSRPPLLGEEYTLEFAAIRDRLIGRLGDTLVKVTNDTMWKSGTGYLNFADPIRDIEVINLDGLPEAEALRLLGVDEKGNDLRGKKGEAFASVTPNGWIDLLAQMDPILDAWKAGGPVGANRWQRNRTALAYNADGKVGKITAPGLLVSGSCEMQVSFIRDADDVNVHLDLIGSSSSGNKTGSFALEFSAREMRGFGKTLLRSDKPFGAQRTPITIALAFLESGGLRTMRVSVNGFDPVTIPIGTTEPLSGTPALSIMAGRAGAIFKEWRLKLGTAKWTANRELAFKGPSLSSAPAARSESESASKAAPFINSLGMKFVPVPITGGPTDKQRVLFSVWETRVQDYEAFATETKREWPKPDFEQGPTHPALEVSWEDATAFCEWLTEKEQKAGKLGAGEVYRLPSDHEWSCAVGIGDRVDLLALPNDKTKKIADVFPWGTVWPPPKGAGNYAGEEMQPDMSAGKYADIKSVLSGYNDGFATTSPVGSFAMNIYGLCDISGNVWEWCEDCHDATQRDRVVRGSSWHDQDRRVFLSANRGRFLPGAHYFSGGFRCVLAPGTPAAP